MRYIILKTMFEHLYVFCGYSVELHDQPTGLDPGKRAIWKLEKQTLQAEMFQFSSLEEATTKATEIGGQARPINWRDEVAMTIEEEAKPTMYDDLKNLPRYGRVLRGQDHIEDEHPVKVVVRRFCIINNMTVDYLCELIGMSKNSMRHLLSTADMSEKWQARLIEKLKEKLKEGYIYYDISGKEGLDEQYGY